jgi:hypothetical protein
MPVEVLIGPMNRACDWRTPEAEREHGAGGEGDGEIAAGLCGHRRMLNRASRLVKSSLTA